MTEQPPQSDEPQAIGDILRQAGGIPEVDAEAEARRYADQRAELIERTANDPESMTEQDKAALQAIGHTALEKQIEKQQKLQQQRDSNPE